MPKPDLAFTMDDPEHFERVVVGFPLTFVLPYTDGFVLHTGDRIRVTCKALPGREVWTTLAKITRRKTAIEYLVLPDSYREDGLDADA